MNAPNMNAEPPYTPDVGPFIEWFSDWLEARGIRNGVGFFSAQAWLESGSDPVPGAELYVEFNPPMSVELTNELCAALGYPHRFTEPAIVIGFRNAKVPSHAA